MLEAAGQPQAVFTGGSMLYGSTGRTDLLGPAHTGELTHDQYGRSGGWPPSCPRTTAVFPTHGFGSFCSATQTRATPPPSAQQAVNPALTMDEQDYVRRALAGLDAYPAYYAHMGPANVAGPGGPDLSPPRRCRRRPSCGAGSTPASGWSTCATARAFAAGHLAGSLSFDAGRQLRHLPGLADTAGAPR